MFVSQPAILCRRYCHLQENSAPHPLGSSLQADFQVGPEYRDSIQSHGWVLGELGLELDLITKAEV